MRTAWQWVWQWRTLAWLVVAGALLSLVSVPLAIGFSHALGILIVLVWMIKVLIMTVDVLSPLFRTP